MTSALGVFAGLAVTVGTLLIGLRTLRRVTDRMSHGKQKLPVRLIQRCPVGPRQAVGLLRVGERVLVVSMVEGGIHLLTELGEDDRVRVLRDPEPPARRDMSSARRWLSLTGISIVIALLAVPTGVMAQTQQDGTVSVVTALSRGAPQFEMRLGGGDEEGGIQLSGMVGIVVFMSALTLLPALFLLMTSFTRIIIVLHFLRTAIGTPSAPPGQLLTIIAVILTGMVMAPIIETANQAGLQPYLRGEITQQQAYHEALQPFRQFMLANTGNQELAVFVALTGSADVETEDDVPTLTLASAFVTSELKTAFQMGFVIFLPFIIIDLIVAAVLMSMGMFMLPPVMVSLPFKLMLFVLADGWSLIIQSLVTSFRM